MVARFEANRLVEALKTSMDAGAALLCAGVLLVVEKVVDPGGYGGCGDGCC